jgi:CRP-like cAMP-binding protein/Fe-S-cluster-containing dehydrogenase component
MSNGDEEVLRGESESLFARDFDGHLIRMDKVTAEQLDQEVTIKIDGRPVSVKRAVPATDAQGNILYDTQKLIIPRATTVLDAAALAYANEVNPIPVLCHRDYMHPVAVCRVCVVQLAKFKRRFNKVDDDYTRLWPACQHRVEPDMEVKTASSPDTRAAERVRSSVQAVLELLMADHPSPCAKERQTGDCELEELARRFGVKAPRFSKRPSRPRDDSSLVIAVDHDACILCDRCIRGCNDIRHNEVIGRAAKGYQARIAFDLDAPMGGSSCVACGECMVSCPTGALTHRAAVEADPWKQITPPPEPVPARALFEHPLPEIRNAFDGVSHPFLQWNSRAVVRRQFRKGDIICREGEFGSTAFLIENGSVDIFIKAPRTHVDDKVAPGLFGLLRRFHSKLASRGEDRREDEGTRGYIPIDAPVALPYGKPEATLGRGDIFGEMTCMSFYPRSATVRAAEDCTVLEMLRNVLYIMQRSKSFRTVLEKKYRQRAIGQHLRSLSIFTSLRTDEAQFEEFVASMREKVSLRRCDPGETIVRQGATAEDGFYLVRTGFVKVTQERPGGELVLNYIGPGGYFGEIALLADLPELRGHLPRGGVRVATCTALDHVDVVRFTPEDFRSILDRFPSVRDVLVREAIERLEQNRLAMQEAQTVPLGDFLGQGLMNAQSLLVLDLEKCTRCDECTKACADTHEGVTRLVREGLRFDKFLVASSCRSCLDPYCMVGCPVGSIRRRESREIIIEDWCIGCGKCAENCPYGNINMHPFPTGEYGPDPDRPDRKIPVVQQKATTCDLCKSLSPNHEPSCVYACPHDAAHRMSGRELLELVDRATIS